MKETYNCPVCDADIEVDFSKVKEPNMKVQCQECKTNYSVDVDGEWFDGMWHDRTTLNKLNETPKT